MQYIGPGSGKIEDFTALQGNWLFYLWVVLVCALILVRQILPSWWQNHHHQIRLKSPQLGNPVGIDEVSLTSVTKSGREMTPEKNPGTLLVLSRETAPTECTERDLLQGAGSGSHGD